METTVKERLISFIKYSGMNKHSFEKACGFSTGFIANMRVSLQPTKVMSIANIFPDLNTGWLLTGEGEMLKQLENVNENVDLVYHYTKLSSFKSILSSNELRLSQISKSNDRKEKKIADEMNLFGREYKYLKYLSLTFGEFGDRNSMLWHFYGEDHGGVCLCLNRSKILDVLKEGVVTYKKDINNNKYSQEEWMFIKTHEWSGEKEYRILFAKDNSQLFDQCIESISFGYDTNISDIIDIINHSSIMMNLYTNRKIFKIQISSTGHIHPNEIHNIPQCVSLIKESDAVMIYSFDDVDRVSVEELEVEIVSLKAENRALREVIGLGERKESEHKSA